MLSAALKEQTKSAHHELEKIFITQIRSLSSGHEYATLLQLLYGFYKPLEDRITLFIDRSLLPDYHKRRKSFNILNDIRALTGTDPADSYIKESSHELPAISNHLHASGALYVLEGSTLGGAIICKMIGDKLQLKNYNGLSYFYSYGENIHAMWQTFKEIIDNMPVSKEDQPEIIKAANETFNGLKTWMKHAK